MRAYVLRLTDDEAALLDAVLAGLKGADADTTPEAWLEAAAVSMLNNATTDGEVAADMQDEAGDRMSEYVNRPEDFSTLQGATMRMLPYSAGHDEQKQTWFMEVGRTTADVRAPGIEYQQVARVEVCAKDLRLLRHILSGHRHKFEYLISEGFNGAVKDALTRVQAEQWKESQKRKALLPQPQPEAGGNQDAGQPA